MSDCDKYILIPDDKLFKNPVSRCEPPNSKYDEYYVLPDCVLPGPEIASKMKLQNLENDEELKEFKKKVAELYEQDSKCRSNKGGKKSKKNRKRRVRKTRKYKGGMEPAACSSSSSKETNLVDDFRKLLKLHGTEGSSVLDEIASGDDKMENIAEKCHEHLEKNLIKAILEINKLKDENNISELQSWREENNRHIKKVLRMNAQNRKHPLAYQEYCKSHQIDTNSWLKYLQDLQKEIDAAITELNQPNYTDADVDAAEKAAADLLEQECTAPTISPKKKSPGKSRKNKRR